MRKYKNWLQKVTSIPEEKVFIDVIMFFTALHALHATRLATRKLSVWPSVCLSVRLSVKRVYCE